MSARLHRRDNRIEVADESGRLVGFIEVRIVQQGRPAGTSRVKNLVRRLMNPSEADLDEIMQPVRFGFVEDIYVRPAWRKQGIGTALLQSSIGWLQCQQIDEIRAAIWLNGESTQIFFNQLGFEPIRYLVQSRG